MYGRLSNEPEHVITAARPKPPILSIVVATLGRTQQLSALLRSIPAGVCSEVEVIVVDQNEAPLRSEVVEFEGRFPLQHLCVTLRNACAARNLGAERSQAQWVMFPDDDAQFVAGALEHLLHLIRTEDLDLISGQIVDEQGRPHLLPWPAEPTPITPATLDRTFVESSFAIRKGLFEQVGGFDPMFGPGGLFHSAEGADLIRRLWRRYVVRGIFTPAIALRHPAKDAMTTEASERVYRFAIGEGAFTARHYRQLPILQVARRLAYRCAGTFICRGEKRRRKLAFLRGFGTGVATYWRVEGRKCLRP